MMVVNFRLTLEYYNRKSVVHNYFVQVYEKSLV